MAGAYSFPSAYSRRYFSRSSVSTLDATGLPATRIGPRSREYSSAMSRGLLLSLCSESAFTTCR